MNQILYVGIGGAIGSILRYLSVLVVYKFYSDLQFPVGTLIVNIIDCFLFGVVLGIKNLVNWINPAMQIFLLTGVLGGFTTFSTFGYDALVLIKSAQWMNAIIYIIGSVFIGVLSVYLGFKVVQI